MRSIRLISPLVIAALVLAGCSSMPRSGAVQSGGAIGSSTTDAVEYLAAGPVKGATALEIIQGFLDAGKAPQNNYRIARSFMTGSIASSWKPADETLVLDHFRLNEKKVGGKPTVVLSATVKYIVDSNGYLNPPVGGNKRSLQFTLTQVAGEWRISSAPDDTILTVADFANTFDAYTVYFYAEDSTTLIPDVRLFAKHNDPATAIARAVMEGPDAQLFPNAYSAFRPTGDLLFTPAEPTGMSTPVTLESASVVVTGGHANVNVSSNLLTASSASRSAMLAEMTASLSGVDGVFSVDLTTDGTVPSIDEPKQLDTNPQVDDRPLIMRDGEVGYATAQSLDPIADTGDVIASLKPTIVNYSQQGFAAVGSKNGVFLVESGSRDKVSSTPSPRAVQVDESRSVWWVERSDSSVIHLHSAGLSSTLNTEWDASSTIEAMELSREGSRIAIAVVSNGRTRVLVGAVSRDASGVPVDISSFREVAILSDRVVDLTWADSTHLAILGSQNGTQIVEYATVGGLPTIIGRMQGGVSIAGGNSGKSGLHLLLNQGELWSPRGTGWQSDRISADVLITQR